MQAVLVAGLCVSGMKTETLWALLSSGKRHISARSINVFRVRSHQLLRTQYILYICLLSVPEHEIPFWNLARVLPNGHTQLVYGGLLKFAFAYEPNVLFQLHGGT